ncbi:MAG: DegV family protein [Nitrolancea sp.]
MTARKVMIVTDSTSDIPPDALGELPIKVVPLKIEIGDRVFRDMVDLSREEFLEHLKTGEMPRTSQPSVGEFQTVFNELIGQGYDVVAIHISPKLSGTFNSATTAARNLGNEHLTIIDSGSVSIGLGVLVLYAAELAAAGHNADEIRERVESRKSGVWVVAVIETLEYLRRGGRIGAASAFLGSALQIKPVIQVKDGEILPLERVRTFKRGLERMLALTNEHAPFDRLAVLHLGAPEGAARLIDQLRERQPNTEILLGQMGTVVGTYGGPGIMGVAGLISERDSSS